nr:NADH dehydrogenase subunit 2 [Nemalecium lighti]
MIKFMKILLFLLFSISIFFRVSLTESLPYQYQVYLILMFILWLILDFDNDNWEKIILSLFMVVGFFIIINTNDLFVVFLGIEIQSFSFIILVSNINEKLSNIEAGLKYFITGILSSITFLIGYLLMWYENPYMSCISFSNGNLSGVYFILISFMIKLGVSPFHLWIIDVLESCSWFLFIVFSIIPKISLILVLTKIINYNFIIELMALLSLISGFMGALNQTKIKRLIAYSNISNMGLILILLKFNLLGYNQPLYLFLILYFINSIIMLVLFKSFTKDNNPFIVNLNKLVVVNSILPLILSLVFLSIGGIPPLSGFYSKWIIILNLINGSFFLQAFLVVIISIFTVIYYLSIMYSVFFRRISNYMKWSNIFLLSQENKISYFKSSITGILLFLSMSSIIIIDLFNIVIVNIL